jgi:hypothetical protein
MGMNQGCDVYLIGHEHATFGHAVKVGIAQNASARLRELQVGNADDLQLYFCYRFEHRHLAADVERYFHLSEVAGPIRGEWVGCNPIEVMAYLNYIIAGVLSRYYPPALVAEARRLCGLLDAFTVTDNIPSWKQGDINDRWAVVAEIMP